jgi:hypothetical protein
MSHSWTNGYAFLTAGLKQQGPAGYSMRVADETSGLIFMNLG